MAKDVIVCGIKMPVVRGLTEELFKEMLTKPEKCIFVLNPNRKFIEGENYHQISILGNHRNYHRRVIPKEVDDNRIVFQALSSPLPNKEFTFCWSDIEMIVQRGE